MPLKICGSSVASTIESEKARTALFAGSFLAVGIVSAIISGKIEEGEEVRGLTATMLVITGIAMGMSVSALLAGDAKNKKDVAAALAFATGLLICLAVSFGRQHDKENEDSDSKRAPVIASSVISLLAFVGISGVSAYAAALCK